MILTYQAVFGAMFSGLDRSIIGAVIVATRGNMPVRKRIPLVKYQLASSSLRSATSLQKKWKTCQRYETTPPSWRQAEKRIEYFPNKFLPNTKFGPATDGPGLLISLIPLVHPIKTVPTDERTDFKVTRQNVEDINLMQNPPSHTGKSGLKTNWTWAAACTP